MKIKKFDYEKAYYLFKKIRCTEEKIIEIYESNIIKSPVHLSLGQESIAVGVALASEKKKDIVFSNYRSHAHFIAHGGNFKKMWAELFGKETGLSSGKAGSMHLGDLGVNFIDTASSYGTEPAVGKAIADINRDDVVLSTKFHPAWAGVVVTPEEIINGLENSLKTLGVEYVDVFHLHELYNVENHVFCSNQRQLLSHTQYPHYEYRLQPYQTQHLAHHIQRHLLIYRDYYSLIKSS